MAVSASYDTTHYSAAGVPLNAEPTSTSFHLPYPIRAKVSIATTELDDAGDLVWLCPVPQQKHITRIDITCADLDSNGSPTLNADLVLRTYDAAGTAVDTVIYDSSGLPAPVSAARPFSAAKAGEVYQLPTPVRVPLSSTGMGHILFKVNAAAATAAAGILIVDVWVV